MRLTTLTAATAVVALAAAPSFAAVASVLASDSSTVQPSGPRTGASGDNFLNIEGENNGSTNVPAPGQASFAVADFNGGSFFGGTAVSSINSVSLTLTQSNAGFTTGGPLLFYFTTQTAVDINANPTFNADDGAAEINFQATVDTATFNSGSATLDTALLPATLIGSSTFVGDATTSGTQDMITLDTAAFSPALVAALNGGGTIRVLITPGDAAVAATYAGFTNTTYAGPTLTVDASLVPEPTTLGLAGVAGLALLRRRRA